VTAVPRHLLAAFVAAALAAAPAAAADNPPAAPHPGAGLIHATVTLDDGTSHVGYLRWVDEDAFWDNIFSARQRDLPWFDFADREQLVRERRQREYGSRGLLNRLAWSLHNREEDVHISRPFICRYGDLAALRLTEDEERPVIAVLRDGREVAVGGPSHDLRSDLIVYPKPDQPVELAWDDVREIRFSAAPAGAVPYAARLAGTVEFRGGSFAGSLQWDTSECTSIDTIDSDEQDVALTQVRRIARSRRGGSDVTLTDGRVLNLDGTNDVGSGNRGAAVDVAGVGRVIVPWNRFIAAELRMVPATSPGYADFAPPRALSGVVTTTDGRTLQGRLVYDLDEATTIDILHGALDECEYQIPFGLVASITPTVPGSCEVVLRDGRRLVLGGDEDTGEGHAGMLVFGEGREKPDYVPWSGMKLVTFAP
jgi:hypothetical protein